MRLIDAEPMPSGPLWDALSDKEKMNVLGYLLRTPTVDAVEVVHAKWECVYDESMGKTDITCSHCKDTRTIKGCYVTVRDEPCYFEDNYCPHCGAKMDGW